MNQPTRLLPSWFVYETVIPLESGDGWSRVEHRKSPKDGFRETKFVGPGELHQVTSFTLGAFGYTGHWFVKVDIGKSSPTFGVIDPQSRKTFIITERPQKHLGRPITYSLPTDDLYNYPGEYVTSC